MSAVIGIQPLRLAHTAPPRDELQQRAARLWPDSDYLQREWLRAVRVVRQSGGGWLLDRRVARSAP
jgi:hypothetical protein